MDKLIEQFIGRYLPRREIIHRLPIAQPISQFWPVLHQERRARSIELPLPDQNGQPFRFVLNSSIERQCNQIADLTRWDAVFENPMFEAMMEDAVIDEAVFSSMIEGAFTSREAAAQFIRKKRTPANRSEQIVQNNYDGVC